MFTDPTKEGFDLSQSVQESTLSLLVYFKDTIKAHRMIPDQPIVIGRAAPADFIVPSDSLSRRHARFEFREDEIWVQDLGSTNGTMVNGEKIERCQITSFDQISLGGIRVAIHLYGESDEIALAGSLSHDEFVECVGSEIVRAETFDRTTATLFVHFEKRIELDRWAEMIMPVLRPVDRWARYGPHIFEICLPEMTESEALKFAEELQEKAQNIKASFGVSSYPKTSTTTDGLFELGLDAVHRASPKQQILVAGAQQNGANEIPVLTKNEDVIVHSASMRELYTLVDRIASANLPVLLQGETGTGKEVLAQAIHSRSPRKEGPLRSINCAAIPKDLIESTLFGHQKGAFTGAERDNQGVFEAAHKGTLLLDEIGELPLAAQAALLRVLETKRVVRIGTHDEIEVDVRVVAATNRDLEQMSTDGSFRSDLYYRLNAFSLKIPPLRDRPEDIVPMAEHFLQYANAANNRNVKGFESDALEMLCRYRWPGNVRELKNIIEHATVVTTGERICTIDLPDRVKLAFETSTAQTPTNYASSATNETNPSFKERVQACEAALIWTALEACEWNRDLASENLKIPRRTLSHKIRAFGIQKRAPNSSESESMDTCLADFNQRVSEVGIEFKNRINRYEASLIEEALTNSAGNKTEAARDLDIPLRTLVFKIGAFGITTG